MSNFHQHLKADIPFTGAKLVRISRFPSSIKVFDARLLPSLRNAQGMSGLNAFPPRRGPSTSKSSVLRKVTKSSRSYSRWYPPHPVAANMHSQDPHKNTPNSGLHVLPVQPTRTAERTCSASNSNGLPRAAVLHVWPVSPVPVRQAGRQSVKQSVSQSVQYSWSSSSLRSFNPTELPGMVPSASHRPQTTIPVLLQVQPIDDIVLVGGTNELGRGFIANGYAYAAMGCTSTTPYTQYQSKKSAQ